MYLKGILAFGPFNGPSSFWARIIPAHNMLNLDMSFENCVNPDQLASEKPADQDQHCFPLCMLIHDNRILQVQ